MKFIVLNNSLVNIKPKYSMDIYINIGYCLIQEISFRVESNRAVYTPNTLPLVNIRQYLTIKMLWLQNVGQLMYISGGIKEL